MSFHTQFNIRFSLYDRYIAMYFLTGKTSSLLKKIIVLVNNEMNRHAIEGDVLYVG